MSSYCLDHRNKKAAEGRERNRKAPEVRLCARPSCGQEFQWLPKASSQRFCSKECSSLAPSETRQAKRDAQREAEFMEGRRWCGSCQQVLALERFYPSRRKPGTPALCADCQKAANERYHAKHPERRRDQQRIAARKRRFQQYGITPEEFDAMVEAQQSTCPICDQVAVLVPDHCHAGNGFRGPICGHCNRGLGYFRDDPAALRMAVEYLETFRLTVTP